MTVTATIGIDVGGTKLAGTALAADGTVLQRVRVATPRDDAAALTDAVAGLVRELGSGVPVGVGAAGIIDRDGTIRYAPNLGVANLPFGRTLSDRLGVPVIVRNDASVALYGEWRVGAGRGVDDLLMLTVGTGVGGGILLGGNLVEGVNGLGGELGHVIVDEGGRLCPCGNAGCLEAYAAGKAIEARAQSRINGGSVTSVLTRHQGRIDGRAITDAAAAGDGFAIEVLEEAGVWLGVGIAGLINAFDPARVLVGGGAGVNAGDILLEPARRTARARIMGAAHREMPDIVLGELGDDAGAIGAGLLALARTA